jgi:SAM-dependent methyltransferase
MQRGPVSTIPKASHEARPRKIEYLSRPAQVSMADDWFEIAKINHFWIRRRFAVLQKLADSRISQARTLAEVGCGHGLLQRQIESSYGKEVTGFDLNERALGQNVSQFSKVCCYDALHREPHLRERFDAIFMFDVLEHISDERSFLDAVMFHLAPGGILIINVPAGQWAYSPYDEAAGHLRRYSIQSLRKAAESSQLTLKEWSYWGFPLVPILVIRRLWLLGKRGQSRIITAGFDTRSEFANWLLGTLSACELLPQGVLGTSLMAIFENPKRE